MIKIIFSGAQGVGKSTFCNSLIKKYDKELFFIPELARSCPYPLDEDSNFYTQWWLMSQLILKEQEALDSKKKIILFDRSLIDNAVFTNLIHKKTPERISKNQKDLIFNCIKNWLSFSPYDKIFFLKVSPNIWLKRDLDDGLRSTNLNWYLELEAEFENVFKELKLPYSSEVIPLFNDKEFESSFKDVELEILPRQQSV